MIPKQSDDNHDSVAGLPKLVESLRKKARTRQALTRYDFYRTGTGDTKMDDVSEFAQRAATEFLERQKTARDQHKLGILAPEVENVVKAAFYASLVPDEGRWPSATLMSYQKGCETQFHFLFPEPADPSPHEIAKLAHAVDTGSHICCICNDGKVKLGGIHVTRLNDHLELGYAAFRIANPLKLIIRGPGHIEFSVGGTALVYKSGQISEESLVICGVVMKNLAQTITNELRELTDGTIEIIPDIMNDLLGAIVRLGHGGLILFADSPKKNHFSPHRELLWCDLLNEALLQYCDVVTDAIKAAGGRDALLNLAGRGVSTPGLLNIALTVIKLEKAIRTIAHLANVDGAIVFDNSLRVAAFNAIIDRTLQPSNSCLIDARGITIDEPEIMKHRGSRHQSALLYAKSNPNSFAFAISQDGSVSAFHNKGNRTVLCEIGMRVLE